MEQTFSIKLTNERAQIIRESAAKRNLSADGLVALVINTYADALHTIKNERDCLAKGYADAGAINLEWANLLDGN